MCIALSGSVALNGNSDFQRVASLLRWRIRDTCGYGGACSICSAPAYRGRSLGRERPGARGAGGNSERAAPQGKADQPQRRETKRDKEEEARSRPIKCACGATLGACRGNAEETTFTALPSPAILSGLTGLG